MTKIRKKNFGKKYKKLLIKGQKNNNKFFFRNT